MSITKYDRQSKTGEEYITDEYLKPYTVFKNNMQDTYVDEMEICSEFEDGIAKQEFQVFIQPVVDVKTGKIASAEALVRWFHETKGFISPGQFIPALEKGGYISNLTVTYGSESYRMSGTAEKSRPAVPVSVNLSWMVFTMKICWDGLYRDCNNVEGRKRKKMIRFEITETSLPRSEESHLDADASERERAKILLDDFGSGYSSFGMLQDYDFDILKIDISFVRNIGVNKRQKKHPAGRS